MRQLIFGVIFFVLTLGGCATTQPQKQAKDESKKEEKKEQPVTHESWSRDLIFR